MQELGSVATNKVSLVLVSSFASVPLLPILAPILRPSRPATYPLSRLEADAHSGGLPGR